MLLGTNCVAGVKGCGRRATGAAGCGQHEAILCGSHSGGRRLSWDDEQLVHGEEVQGNAAMQMKGGIKASCCWRSSLDPDGDAPHALML
jgi:hypothetical protein